MDIKSFLKSASSDELKRIQDSLKQEIKERQNRPGKINKILTYTDGASRGNPGDAGIGFLIFDDHDEKLFQNFHYIGQTTNNEAEYRALLAALDQAYEISHGDVECYLDSELVVRQLNGKYAVKSEKMAQFYNEVLERASKFSSVVFKHVSREHPRLKMADRLANKGIDEAKPKRKV